MSHDVMGLIFDIEAAFLLGVLSLGICGGVGLALYAFWRDL